MSGKGGNIPAAALAASLDPFNASISFCNVPIIREVLGLLTPRRFSSVGGDELLSGDTPFVPFVFGFVVGVREGDGVEPPAM